MELTLDRIRQKRHLAELTGFLLLVLGGVTLLALLSYSAGDSTWFNHRPRNPTAENWLGRVGAMEAEGLLQIFGVAAFLVPLFLLRAGWRWLRGDPEPTPWHRVLGRALLALMLCALLDLLYGSIRYDGSPFPAGGYAGSRIAAGLREWFNGFGALVVVVTALAAALVLLTRVSLVRIAVAVGEAGRTSWTPLASRLRDAAAARRERAAAAVLARGSAPPAAEAARVPAASPAERSSIVLEPSAAAPVRVPRMLVPAAEPSLPPADSPRPGASKRPPAATQPNLPMEPGRRGYTLPPLELLNEPQPQLVESEHELLERARLITDKLREFAVNGSVVAIHPGPIVTTFEFKPEAGVKYSKITGMTDDLSLALKAESVRIDRMVGRATVGIEVPNRHQATIFPRDLFASDAFRNSKSKLTLALGKDISGDVLVADLDRMPHLLIAGATGSGKSVGLNGMITSLLYKATPEEVRLIMIDTKMIELGIYADIPHLLIPVVTEAKHASAALKWAVREMEQRYRKLAAVGVRNIAQFNKLLEREPERALADPKTGEPVPLSRLAYIVIVIDELADLMMIASSDVEEAIMRLAQMARAVGIHLIIATQRPSVDVITGTIKANFPSRIAFRVSQRVDSRTIIDQQGAEHLLGRGDMLYLSSGASRLLRVHGGLFTEPELHHITEFLKRMAQPEYDEAVLRDPDEQDPGSGGGERDEMYAQAVRTVLQEEKCSVTLIQRRLQLGYARAARIVDMMEREGVVSPGEGSKPREILVGPEYLEQLGADASA